MTPTGLRIVTLFRGKVASTLAAPGDWGALTLNQVGMDTAPKTPIRLVSTQTLNTWMVNVDVSLPESVHL